MQPFIDILKTDTPNILNYLIGNVINPTYRNRNNNIINSKLKRNAYLTKTVTKDLPNDVLRKETKIKLKEINNSTFNKYLYIFITTISKYYDDSQMDNLRKNLLTLKVDGMNLNDSIIVGDYNYHKNILTINNNRFNAAIFHELFHISSTLKRDGEILCGFSDNSFGMGLTEGYTELLSRRCFSKYINFNAYVIETHLASELESIIGMNEMQDLYLNANMTELIRILENYIPLKDVVLLLTNIDKISRLHSNILLNNKVEGNELIFKKIKDVQLQINKIKYIKWLNDNNKDNIEENFIEYISTNDLNIITKVVMINNLYEVVNKEVFKNELFELCVSRTRIK